jgi:hypothetical protein
MKTSIYVVSICIILFASIKVIVGASEGVGSSLEIFMLGCALSILASAVYPLFSKKDSVMLALPSLAALAGFLIMVYAMTIERNTLFFYYMLSMIAMHVHNGVRETYGKDNKEESALH